MSDQAAAARQKQEEERSGFLRDMLSGPLSTMAWIGGLLVIGFFIGRMLGLIPEDSELNKTVTSWMDAIKKQFGWDTAKGMTTEEIQKVLVEKVQLPTDLATALASQKDELIEILKTSGKIDDPTTLISDPAKAKAAILGNPDVLKALLTNEKIAPALMKLVPGGEAVQRQLLAAFKTDFNDAKFKALADALAAAKPDDIKQTLINKVVELLPENRKVAMTQGLIEQLSDPKAVLNLIKTQDPTTLSILMSTVSKLPGLPKDVYPALQILTAQKDGRPVNIIALKEAVVTMSEPAAQQLIDLVTSAQAGKGIDIGKTIGLMQSHGSLVSRVANQIVVPEVAGIDAGTRSQIIGGLKFVAEQKNVAAITQFVSQSGLNSQQVQRILGVLQSKDPKAALQADGDLSTLVSQNITKIGKFLETLDSSKLDDDTRDKLDLLTRKRDGRYIGLEQLFGVKSASAVQIESSKVASAVPEVVHKPIETGHAPDGHLQAAKLAVVNSSIQIG